MGNMRAFCDLKDPDFEKSTDLRGQCHSPVNYGLADRAKGNFVAGERRPTDHRAVLAARLHQSLTEG